jgi:outer membrane lipoprotein carrier protein
MGALLTLSSSADTGVPEELHAFLAGLESLTADFRQEVVTRELELVEEARGRVSLKKPGRFRWDYTEPFERVIVADGSRLWLYEADLDQVTVRNLDAGLGETPAALLSGDVDVLDRFEYQGASTRDGLRWLELKPRSQESDFDSIWLAFDSGNLSQLALEDRLGQTTRIYLSDIEMNTDITDDFFKFEIPDGADIIGETEL